MQAGIMANLEKTAYSLALLKEAAGNFETPIRDRPITPCDLCDQGTMAFFLQDAQTRKKIWVSKGYELMFDTTLKEEQEDGLAWFQSIHPDDRQMMIEAYEKVNREGIWAGTFRVSTRHGWEPVKCYAFPIKNHKLHGYFGFAVLEVAAKKGETAKALTEVLNGCAPESDKQGIH